MSRESGHSDIIGAVQGAIAALPRSSPDRIRVSFLTPDTVALCGEVGSLAEKEEIGRCAAQAARSCHIDNSLTVGSNRPRPDAVLEDQAREALFREGLTTLGARIRGGVAHLQGRADTLALVDRAKRVVGEVEGIREILTDHVALAAEQVTELVAPAPVPSDRPYEVIAALDEAAIGAGVASRLAAEFGMVGSQPVTVTVRRRSVVLTGTVRTGRERSLAEQAARNVPGVAHVFNLLVATDGSAGRNAQLESEIRHLLGRPKDHATPVDLKVFVVADEVFLFGQADFPEQVDEAIALVREAAGGLPVHTDVTVTSRHPRSASGPGHAVEDAHKKAP